VSDVLDSGPDEPRAARGWQRWARGGRVRRWLGVAVVVGLAAVALAAAVRPPAHAPDSVPAAVLSIPQGEVKLDGRDQAAALSLIVVNTGASSYLDAINGLPARLVFVPPRGGLPMPGGTGTRLPLAWPRVDCTTPADALGRDLGAATLVLRNSLANGSVVALGSVTGAVAQILRLREEACAHFTDL
jgi:hypothetical protein